MVGGIVGSKFSFRVPLLFAGGAAPKVACHLAKRQAVSPHRPISEAGKQISRSRPQILFVGVRLSQCR